MVRLSFYLILLLLIISKLFLISNFLMFYCDVIQMYIYFVLNCGKKNTYINENIYYNI